MRCSKGLQGALLATLIVASPVFSQELDGTLKKIKDSGTLTLGYLEFSGSRQTSGRLLH
jgi:glutamate/aspartate transport system substrate-binding protein